MRTVQATETAVSIWFSHEDIPTREQVLCLVRQALAERGIAPWQWLEMECFAAGEDALVIARPAHDVRPAFYFDDLEALLGGALACGDGDSSLYKAEEGYILTVDEEGAGPALYEYGEACTVSGLWEHHAREQGLCLMEGTAISQLRRYFAA